MKGYISGRVGDTGESSRRGGGLSRAAASALSHDDDGDDGRRSERRAASQDPNHDVDLDYDRDVPSPLLSASPNSSAPSSPKGSVAGDAVALVDVDQAASAAATTMTPGLSSSSDATDAPNPPPPSSSSSSSWVDPYADVRDRMEALSLRDRRRHVHGEKKSASLPSASAVSGENADAMCGSPGHVHQDITLFAAITTYLGYVVLIVTGHVRDVCANVFRKGRYFRSKSTKGNGKNGDSSPAASPSSYSGTGNYPSDDLSNYAPLLKSWENFYTRRLYHRIQDCFNRPIASRPSARISVLERVSYDGNKTMSVLGRLPESDRREDGDDDDDDEHDDNDRGGRPQRASHSLHRSTSSSSYREGEHFGESPHDGRAVRRCLNLGSYNYLGFADDWDVTCRPGVLSSLDSLPPSVGSSRLEFGTTSLHRRVERIVAGFLGKEDAVALNMGFNTNATVIPALTSRGDLIVSDELNHTSIVNGARASGAAIRTFRHNDAADLELVLREAIVHGRPRTRRPWNRVLVVVEGIYSMEGEYCDLGGVVAVCKKYGAYVYLDEAHSVGAMGRTGRGCCEHCGVDPAEVDVLMGTFTKSFGGMGGYVAADRGVIDVLRKECAGSAYHNSLSPVVCQQIVSSFQVIMGEDGTDIGRRKLDSLRDNSNYFRMRLSDMGLHVLGNYDSPIMPVMLYNPTKIAAFSRECLKRGLAVVVVGFPAVPILMSRARFCISAGHTRTELDGALRELDEIADLLKLRYARSTFG